jgi:hypothetical protein
MLEGNGLDEASSLRNKEGILVRTAKRGWRIGESSERSGKAVQHCRKSLTIV